MDISATYVTKKCKLLTVKKGYDSKLLPRKSPKAPEQQKYNGKGTSYNYDTNKIKQVTSFIQQKHLYRWSEISQYRNSCSIFKQTLLDFQTDSQSSQALCRKYYYLMFLCSVDYIRDLAFLSDIKL